MFFFLVTCYLLFTLYIYIYIFFIDYVNDVRKQILKQNLLQKQIFFLGDFKMGPKVAETAHNINNIFGRGTANERAVQWWFKK